LTLTDIFTVLRSYSLPFTFGISHSISHISSILLQQEKQKLVQIYIICSCSEDMCAHRTPNSSWTGCRDLNFWKTFNISE